MQQNSAAAVFVGGGHTGSEVFSLWPETKSVGAHSICARGSLSCRKRARADTESAPTFFVGATIGRPPAYRRNAFSGTVSCTANGHGRAMLAPTKVFRQSGPEIFRATARFSPPPPTGGAPSQRGPREGARLSESEIRRGAFYMRPRKFILPQTGTGGYGIRPYVFEGTGVARPLHTMPTSPTPALQAWVSAVGFAPPSRGSIPTGLSCSTKTPTCFHT